MPLLGDCFGVYVCMQNAAHEERVRAQKQARARGGQQMAQEAQDASAKAERQVCAGMQAGVRMFCHCALSNLTCRWRRSGNHSLCLCKRDQAC